MAILKYKVADRLYQSETGPEVQVGDQVKLFLDTDANPELPEFVFGIVQPGIRRVDCDEYTIYSIEYDLAEFTLRQDDVIDTEITSAVDVVAGDLGIETAARIAADALLAPKASPAFTGNPTAPTPTLTDNDTSVATTAFVQGQSMVRYTAQSLSDPQKLQVQENIGIDSIDYENYNLLRPDQSVSLNWGASKLTSSFATDVLFWSTGNLQVVDGVNILFGSSSGTVLAGTTTQKFAFHGAAAVAQRAGAAQVAVPTTVLTVSNPPTQAEVQAIIDRLALVTTLDNELRAALVQKGLIKGSS